MAPAQRSEPHGMPWTQAIVVPPGEASPPVPLPDPAPVAPRIVEMTEDSDGLMAVVGGAGYAGQPEHGARDPHMGVYDLSLGVPVGDASDEGTLVLPEVPERPSETDLEQTRIGSVFAHLAAGAVLPEVPALPGLPDAGT